jgi:ubiquitin-protein ligase
MFATITISKDVAPALQYDYQHLVHIEFPDDYPFSAPSVVLDEDDLLQHPLIVDEHMINMCDYTYFIDISQLLMNVYLIFWEALNDKQNANVVERWNQ